MVSLNFIWGEQPFKKCKVKYGRKEDIIGKEDKVAKVILSADIIIGEMCAMKVFGK